MNGLQLEMTCEVSNFRTQTLFSHPMWLRKIHKPWWHFCCNCEGENRVAKSTVSFVSGGVVRSFYVKQIYLWFRYPKPTAGVMVWKKVHLRAVAGTVDWRWNRGERITPGTCGRGISFSMEGKYCEAKLKRRRNVFIENLPGSNGWKVHWIRSSCGTKKGRMSCFERIQLTVWLMNIGWWSVGRYYLWPMQDRLGGRLVVGVEC